MNEFSRREPRVYALVLAACWLSGCGGATDDLPRVAVSGRVTLDGKPLDTASISFQPDGQDNKSPVAVGGSVMAGSYSIAKAEGPTPGKYRVSIDSSGDSGTPPPGEAPGAPPRAVTKALVPDKYNTKSTLTAEITPGSANTINFELTTK